MNWILKNVAILLIVFVVCFSCKKHTTTSDVVLEQDISLTIDASSIDGYPLFDSCKETLSLSDQKRCFTTTLSKEIQAIITQTPLVLTQTRPDTIYIEFYVSRRGNLILEDTLEQEVFFPEIQKVHQYLTKAFKRLPKIHPAQKQGIAVQIKCKFPLILALE